MPAWDIAGASLGSTVFLWLAFLFYFAIRGQGGWFLKTSWSGFKIVLLAGAIVAVIFAVITIIG